MKFKPEKEYNLNMPKKLSAKRQKQIRLASQRYRLKKQVEKNVVNKLTIKFQIDGVIKQAKPLSITQYEIQQTILEKFKDDSRGLKKTSKFLNKYGKNTKYFTNKKLLKLLDIDVEKIESDLKRLGQPGINKQTVKGLTGIINQALGTGYPDDLYDDTSEGGGRELILAYNAARKLIKEEYWEENKKIFTEEFKKLKQARQEESLRRLRTKSRWR